MKWTYDLILDAFIKDEKRNNMYKSNINNNYSHNYESRDLEVILQSFEGSNIITRSQYNQLNGSKPILIKPTIIDSLFFHDSKSSDMIKNFHVPFNDIFFELQKPVDTYHPIKQKEAHISGISYHHKQGKENNSMTLYYKNINSNKLCSSLNFTIFPHKPNVLGGIYHNFDSNDMVTNKLYLVDLTQEVLYFSKSDGTPYSKSIKKLKDPLLFQNMNNFSANLINFINSLNVTYEKRTRKVFSLVINKKGKTEKRILKKPYYVTRIESKNINLDSDNQESGRSLTERIYVRGHSRRYRDDVGEIYKTIWIDPFIKGPNDAPFRDQRYELLAKELEEYKKYS
jgi:hypothetical protein